MTTLNSPTTCISVVICPLCDIRNELSSKRQSSHSTSTSWGYAYEHDVMLRRIQTSNLGIEVCLRSAMESIHWPQINADVKCFIEQCETCLIFDSNQEREPLKPHEVPPRSLILGKVDLDIFTFDRHNYLTVTDYFSDIFKYNCWTSWPHGRS